MSRKKRNIVLIIAAVIVLGVVIAGMSFYGTVVNESLSDTTRSTLDEVTSQQQYSFDSELATEMVMMKSIANTLVIIGIDEEGILKYLSSIEQYHKFANLGVVDMTGNGIMADGEYIIGTDLASYSASLEGETVMSEPMLSAHDEGQRVVTISTPIFEQGEVTGLLIAEYSLDYLDNLLYPSFEGNGNAYVINQKGEIVANTDTEHSIVTNNLFDIFVLADFSMSDERTVRSNIEDGTAGGAIFTMDDVTNLVEYRPLDFNEWSLLVIVPTDVISEESFVILNAVNIYNIVFAGLVLVLFVIIVWLQRRSIKEVEQVAYYDDLTGTPNMRKIKLELADALRKNPGTEYTVVKFDVVNFKAINEIFDYETGDNVIKAIADVGRNVDYPSFMQARIGTDEFILFADSEFFSNLEETRIEKEAVFNAAVDNLGNYNFEFRYGRYQIEKGETDVNVIMSKVALAHGYSKLKNEIISDYDGEFKEHLIKTTEIKNKMRKALENNEFKVYLQPKYNLSSENVVGAEALVRWVEADGRMIYPNDFIPVFESNGFITELDKHMLSGVCAVLKEWADEGIECVPVSVNFSRLHLANPNFVDEIGAIVDGYGVPRSLVEAELTETAILDNEKALQSVLKDLHDGGFTLSMDDFGSGYSSLGLLKDFDVDVIKMDRSFFVENDIVDMKRGNLVVESVVEMAKKLGITTVAEGVETVEQAEFLRSIDCEIAQGYYYARPIPAEDFKYECFGIKRSE